MFTSRLPVSTSVRRPTNDGSTSFHRQSNIPITVRKANLFTPQTKRPFQNGGTSTAGKSYMSGMATDKKYQRPLKPAPDRDSQIKMFEALVDYLASNAYHSPLPDAKKFFSSVSTTESSRIFEFLIGKLLPDFKINRLEIDVPDALAQLDYPYIRSVTKSALVSVTTRQAAVGLLVIFDWLIRFVIAIEDDNNDDEDRLDTRDAISREIIQNEPDKLTEALDRLFDERFPPQDIQSKQNELEEVEAELHKIIQDLAQVDELMSDCKTLEDDVEKCEKYHEQMQIYIQTRKDEENELRRIVSSLEIQNEEKLKELTDIQLSIKVHELVIDEVERDQAISDNSDKKLAAIMLSKSNSIKELEKAKENYLKLSTRFIQQVQDLKPHLRKLLSVYDSYTDLETEQLSERRMKLKEWILKFEQLPRDDLAQHKRFLHDFKLFIHKLNATNPSLESEIKDRMSDQKLQVEELEEGNSRLKEELMRLHKTIEKSEQDFENEKQSYKENLSIKHVLLEEDSRKLAILQEELSRKDMALRQALKTELQGLERDKQEIAERSRLNLEYLSSVLEHNREQATALVEERRKKSKRWNEALIVAKENNLAARTIAKLIK